MGFYRRIALWHEYILFEYDRNNYHYNPFEHEVETKQERMVLTNELENTDKLADDLELIRFSNNFAGDMTGHAWVWFGSVYLYVMIGYFSYLCIYHSVNRFLFDGQPATTIFSTSDAAFIGVRAFDCFANAVSLQLAAFVIFVSFGAWFQKSIRDGKLVRNKFWSQPKPGLSRWQLGFALTLIVLPPTLLASLTIPIFEDQVAKTVVNELPRFYTGPTPMIINPLAIFCFAVSLLLAETGLAIYFREHHAFRPSMIVFKRLPHYGRRSIDATGDP